MALPTKVLEDAIEFYRKKLNLPTATWRDIQREAHDVAFVIAGAQDADLLADFRAEMDRAVDGDLSYGEFRRSFKKIVADRGWTGWTGEGSEKGEAWRSLIIYDTNTRQAYNAGRERTMSDPAFRQRRPYRMYRHGGSKDPRQGHLALDRKVFAADDPFWLTGSPMNGFGCTCTTFSLTERDMARLGLTPEPGPPDFKPDEGFDYRPGGDAVRRAYDVAAKKAASYPRTLFEQFMAFLSRFI